MKTIATALLSSCAIALLGATAAGPMDPATCHLDGVRVSFMVTGGGNGQNTLNWTPLPSDQNMQRGKGYSIREIADQGQPAPGPLKINYGVPTGYGTGIDVGQDYAFVVSSTLDSPHFAYPGGSGKGALITLEQCQ